MNTNVMKKEVSGFTLVTILAAVSVILTALAGIY